MERAPERRQCPVCTDWFSATAYNSTYCSRQCRDKRNYVHRYHHFDLAEGLRPTRRAALAALLVVVLAPLAVAANRDNIVPVQNTTTGVLTLPQAPNPASSLHLYVNGLRQKLGEDYTLAGKIITPTAKAQETYRKPVALIVADYRVP